MDTYYDIVKDAIESTGVDYVENDKSVWLDGLDFAVPSRKLAIKINRVSVENNDVTATTPIRERGYHKKMHDSVENAGWELLSLDDRQLVDPSWSNITKPFILMKIAGTAEHVIYGRDVSITRVEVPADLRYANDFLKDIISRGMLQHRILSLSVVRIRVMACMSVMSSECSHCVMSAINRT